MSKGLLFIPELRTKWRKEKTFYEVREVGTGVQIFVKDVLKSPEVFALKVGLNSTKLEDRKNEFLEEKTSKGRNQPDITIFITPQIKIPVEVERYKNIDAGRSQLFQYQIDLDKKYGILTDGYTWQFYNNNEYREYTLKTILDNTGLFLEFWREYIKPEKYYLSFFEKRWQHSLLQETEQLPVEDYRQLFFEDITKLIASFKNKLDIEGYLNGLPQKERTKTAVEITYAYIIQFILYKTLVDNEFDDFPKEYETLVEAIHGHLKQDRFKDVLGSIDGISATISKNIYRPFSKEQEFIRNKLWDILHKTLSELHDVSPWLDIFVFIKKYNFAEVRNEIFGYIYENYLKALYEDQKKGQYFTDPAVVNFMLEQVGYTPENLKSKITPDKNTISLIDPACGSGTFLYSAVDTLIRTIGHDSEQRVKKVKELVNKDIFGLDIAEFPLYLAEMNILMRMLPLIINEKYNNPIEKKIKVFKTRDSIAEFMDTALRNTIHDIDVAVQKNNGQGFLFKEKLDLGYVSYVRDKDDLKEMKESLESRPRCPRRRFDFVIANPPYVGYNECCKQKVLITKLIQEKKIQMSNIYGVNLNTVPGRIKAYAPKPNLYAFFVSLGLALLKDNAKLCYIIPQTILTSGDLDVIRYHLAKFTTIEKIVTFEGKMFVGRGIKQDKPVATSSLIFVTKRKIPNATHKVEIVNYKNPNDTVVETLKNIISGRKISKKKILQGKLLQSVVNWNFLKHDKKTSDFIEQYIRNETIYIYRMPELSKSKFNSVFYFDKGLVFAKDKITKLDRVQSDKEFYHLVSTHKDKLKLDVTNNVIFKKDLRFPKGSQGIDVYEKKYKIIWRYMNTKKFYFSEDNIMVNFNWIVISSENKKEIEYILSLLNSKCNRFVFNNLLKSESEKDILIGIRSIKEFLRVPRIFDSNQHIKDEIIKQTEEMIDLEQVKLADLIDFSQVMMQKFDAVSVTANDLVLRKDKKEKKLKIKSNKELVEKTVIDKYRSGELEFEHDQIKLSELKSLLAIDFEKQEDVKDYIDDLVFALYFNIPLTKVGLKHRSEIKQECQKNKFYKLLNKLS